MSSDLSTSFAQGDERPLPLIVAEKWGFPLQHYQHFDVPGGYLYALQDWAMGLVGENGKQAYRDFKRSPSYSAIVGVVCKLPYKAKDGKTYYMDYVTADGLIAFAAYTKEFHLVTWERLLNWKKSKRQEGFIYLIGLSQIPNYYKIGIAIELKSRMTSVRINNPFGAYYVHTVFSKDYFEVETFLHTQFENRRVSGEWFLLSPEDVEQVVEVMDAHRMNDDEFESENAQPDVKTDPEAAIRVSIDVWRKEGKPNLWIEGQIKRIVKREHFIKALRVAIADAPSNLYAEATEKVYKGLWQRTTAQLQSDLRLQPHQNIRDHFGEYALIYTRLAENVAKDKLGDAETVTVEMAMNIVWAAAKLIRKQAQATAKELGIDLVTGKPLLKARN